MKTKNNWIAQVGHEVIVKIGVGFIMFIAGAILTIFMAMNSGSKDGTQAKQENINQQRQIDTLKSCRQSDRMIIERLMTLMEDQKEVNDRMDKRIEVLYINELEKND